MINDSRVGFLDLKALSLKDDLEREDINKLIAYMKPLMINATDRNVINHDNYQFYFNKLLTLINIKIQNDVLTKEIILGWGIKSLSTIGGIIGSGFFMFNFFSPDTIPRNAGTVAMGASTVAMLSRVNTLINVGYGEELDNDSSRKTICEAGSMIQEEYINKCNCDFVRKGGKFLNKLYINNE